MTQPNLSNILHPFRFAKRLLAFLAALSFLAALDAQAGTRVWNGGGTSNVWSDAGNWTGGAGGGDLLTFGGTTRLTNSNNFTDANATNISINFANNAGAFVLGGNTAFLTQGITNSSTNSIQTLNLGLTFQVATASIATASNGMIMNGVVAGTNINKTGASTLFLNGSNSFTGIFTNAAGATRVGNNSGLGTTNNGTVIVSGGALELTTNTNGVSITITNEALSLAGTGINSGGALRNITGDNVYGGLITLTNATRINSDSGTLSITNTGTITGATFGLTFGGAGNVSVASIISNTTGVLTKDGAGTLFLTASNRFTGGTTINAGTIAISNNGAFASNNVTFASNGTTVAALASILVTNNIALTGNGTLDVGGNILTNSGAISGAGSLTKLGAGTLLLSASNNYSGGTLLNAGTLIAGTNTAFGTNSITISAGVLDLGNFSIGNLIVNNGGTLTNLGTVSGAQLNAGTTTLAASNNTVAEVSGTATVDLSGANTTITNVTGGTVNVAATSTNSTLQTVSAGTINAATNITVQTLNGGNLSVSNGSAVAVSSGNSAGSISGAGNLIKTGSGTLQLSGNNNFTGATFISNGVVAVSTNAALAGTTLINLNNGTALAYSGGSATIDRNISVTNGTAAIRNTGGGTLTLAGSLSKNGTVLVFSNGTFNVTGVISGASANSDLVVDNAVVTLSNANTYVGPTFIRNAGNLTAAVVGAMPTNTRSALIMDDSGSGSSIFNVTASQQIASLTGAASSSATIATNTSLTVGTNATNTTFAGVISGGGSLVKDGSSTQTLTGANTYSGGTLVSSGVLSGNSTSLQGNITNNASVVFDQAANGTYAGVLSGSGSLTKNNAGTLTITAANTQSGTTISAGALQIGNGGSTGSLSGPITNNGSLIFNLSDVASTQSGVISGSGALTKLGAGTVTLSAGNNTYGGTTTIAGGVLAVGTLANAGSASSIGTNSVIVLTNDGVLRYTGASVATDRNINLAGNGVIGVSNGTTALTISGVISNTGALRKFGSGTLILSGANTYTGGTEINTGALQIGNGGTTGSIAGVITNNASLIYDRSDNLTQSAVVSGTGSVTKSGAGTVTLSASNSYAGGTFLNAGALRLANTAGFGSGAITQNNSNSVLIIDTVGTVTNQMSVYNLRSLANAVLSGAKTLNNATYDIAASTTTTDSGALSGSGGITKLGTGTLVLTASNTFTGAVDVQAGLLNLNSSTGFAAGSTTNVSVSSGATLLVSQNNQVNNAATVSLSGGTIRTASGVNEVFGNLSVSSASFLDFGTTSYANQNTISFGTYTPSALLTINNFDFGSTLVFKTDLSSSITNSSFFAFNNGGISSYSWNAGTSTFTITAIPEPSTYLAAAGLLGVMLWPSRRRIIRDAKRILGLRPPMRDRLEALRGS